MASLRSSIVLLRLFGNSNDELRLSPCVRHSVAGHGRRKPRFEAFVFSRRLGLLDQVVAEEEPVPMLGEIALYHVDVMRSGTGLRVSLDEPRVERRAVVPVRGPRRSLQPHKPLFAAGLRRS